MSLKGRKTYVSGVLWAIDGVTAGVAGTNESHAFTFLDVVVDLGFVTLESLLDGG